MITLFNYKYISLDHCNSDFLEKFCSDVYVVGHRPLEELIDGPIVEKGFKEAYCFDNDFFVGLANSKNIQKIFSYLEEKFISGYVIWCDKNINLIDFKNYFFFPKSACILTSIYRAKWTESLVVIDFEDDFDDVQAIALLESGEKNAVFCYKNDI